MRLKRIDILGFKSFKDRMSLEFSEGMTAIVGPNGCGKSNVVDAMKWAMGDMSPKSLRGQAMEDVIFAGSESARPLGMAEVTIVFDNVSSSTEWADSIPREFREVSEIAVTRRLHRAGESEYLINKVACRLMDIQNLLAGTGVGKQGYSIIEQNQVGFIVSSRPSERRLLIEEASGITRYKAQRERTVKRLEKAEENLQRADDVLSEITRQIRSLERQAQRAAQYRRLSEELKSLELRILRKKRESFSQQFKEYSSEHTLAEGAVALAEQELLSHEVAQQKLKESIQIEERRLSDATENFYRLETRLTLAKTRKEHALESKRDAESRLETSRRELVAQAERRQRLMAELEIVEGEYASSKSGDLLNQEVEQKEGVLRELRTRLVDAENAARKVRAKLEVMRSEFHRMQDRSAWLDAQLEEMSARESEIDRQLLMVSQDQVRWGEELEAALGRLEATNEGLRVSQIALQNFEQVRAEVELEAETARNLREEVQRAYLAKSAKLESLQSLRGSGEGFGAGVRAVMNWAQSNSDPNILGPLAELLSVPEELEDQVAGWLGERMQHVISRSLDSALAAARATKGSKLTFEILEEFDESFSESIVRNFREAKSGEVPEMSANGEIIVFEDGAMVGQGRVVVPGPNSEGLDALRRNNQIKELLTETAKLNSELETLVLKYEESRAALRIALQHVDEARAARDVIALEERDGSRKVEEARREVERTTQHTERIRGQLVPMLRRRELSIVELDEIKARSTESGVLRNDATVELQANEALVVELRREVEARHMSLTEDRVEQAKIKERRRNLEESLNRLQRSVSSAESLADRYSKEMEELGVRISELDVVARDSAESEVGMAEEVAAAEELVEQSREGASRAQSAAQKLEVEMKELRQTLDERRRILATVTTKMREVELGLSHLEEQLQEQFGLTWEEAEELSCELQLPEEEHVSRRDYLRRRLDSMGPVNSMAEQEYLEAQERETFLIDQKDDLVRSVSDLRKAIAEMDRESRKRFRETFEAVDAQFREIFPRLFRGGHARLLLTDPDDMLTTGVDIEVCPPGKRLQNVTLLSGGEKALTAVSLIFSIFMLKPTPFSILDEVDAPLDEANVGRFAQMVREMSSMSQMIVITHSRRTMEAAELLYGVTMEEPGVSKIVSVRLSDAENILAS